MACENGHSKIAEMLIQKSAELNIDLNAKHRLFDRTSFQLAYENGHFIKLIIFSSAILKLTVFQKYVISSRNFVPPKV